MAYGTVTWFDAERGHGLISRAGFVSRDNGGAEIFVHESQVNGGKPPHIGISEGDRVTFTLEPHAGGLRAADVHPISRNSAHGDSAEQRTGGLQPYPG